MKTVIRLSGSGGELDKVVMDYDDATTEAIARAVIELVQSTGMSMSTGDTITVTDEE
jgi:hypothetical protein